VIISDIITGDKNDSFFVFDGNSLLFLLFGGNSVRGLAMIVDNAQPCSVGKR
jgi:hypothetical protein